MCFVCAIILGALFMHRTDTKLLQKKEKNNIIQYTFIADRTFISAFMCEIRCCWFCCSIYSSISCFVIKCCVYTYVFFYRVAVTLQCVCASLSLLMLMLFIFDFFCTQSIQSKIIVSFFFSVSDDRSFVLICTPHFCKWAFNRRWRYRQLIVWYFIHTEVALLHPKYLLIDVTKFLFFVLDFSWIWCDTIIDKLNRISVAEKCSLLTMEICWKSSIWHIHFDKNIYLSQMNRLHSIVSTKLCHEIHQMWRR